jgi:hypothetical protein
MKFNYPIRIAMQRKTDKFYGGKSHFSSLCHAKEKGKERLNRSMKGCLTDFLLAHLEAHANRPGG